MAATSRLARRILPRDRLQLTKEFTACGEPLQAAYDPPSAAAVRGSWEQQLSLVPDETIQGSLFAPEPSEDEAEESEGPTKAQPSRTAPRPCSRRKRGQHQHDDEDYPLAPPRLGDPLALTPMLRHYVELKAAHPERVLLYASVTSSNVSSKTPC